MRWVPRSRSLYAGTTTEPASIVPRFACDDPTVGLVLIWEVRNPDGGATGLEWGTSSPPPADNFEVTPTVTLPPYVYSREEAQVV